MSSNAIVEIIKQLQHWESVQEKYRELGDMKLLQENLSCYTDIKQIVLNIAGERNLKDG